MFTFASIFLIMMVGQSFAQDRENGMMKRIRITPTSSTEFIASQVISYMGIALIQAALVFALTYALGFQPAVGIATYLFAFILVYSVLRIKRRFWLNHRNHREIIRRSHWHCFPLRDSADVPWNFHRSPLAQQPKSQANSYPATT